MATGTSPRHSTQDTLRFLLFLLFLILAPSPATAQELENNHLPLFENDNLNGWIIEGAESENFAVSEGVLRVRGPRGWLRSTRTFSDFDLRFEVRFLTEGADSGLFFRASSLGGFGRGWPNRSYQIQLRDMHAPSNFLPLGHLYRHGMPQGETNHLGDRAVEGFRGVGDWHRIDLVVEGENVVVLLEGEEVLRASAIGNTSGYIGFQGEAGEVEFRSIWIRER